MQAQSIKQKTITFNQSLQIVQTLLRAGFGCIAYLRGLLSDENFTESHLNSSSGVSPSDSQESSSASVKLKTIKRGWSAEGDRLLQYLEKGIFDALEKQYLRSFIFAIYLDEENPENLIEAYTFNFSYYDVPGIPGKIPVMTLNEQLDSLSLNTNFSQSCDPIVQSIHQGKQPTLNELKQSVKYLIRRLIAAVQTLNPLPSRRFVTFKLFYLDGTPDDYEPPYFYSGDSGKQYFFRTRSENEVPDNITIGSLQTPYHYLNLCIDSISDLVPQCNENDVRYMRDARVYTLRMSTIHKMFQNKLKITQIPTDAPIVWNAERSVNSSTSNSIDIELSTHERQSITGTHLLKMDTKSEGVKNTDSISPLEQNCALSPTQVLGANGLMTPYAIHSPVTDSYNKLSEADMSMCQSCEVSTQALTNFLLERDANNEAAPPISPGQVCNTNTLHHLADKGKESYEDVINCDCGVNDEEEADVCQCEGPCQNWFHIWCLGYHSMHDERLPSSFWCFSCRLRNDPEIEILDSKNLTSQYITKYKDLCLFRRAIKIVLNRRPDNVSAFTKLLGTDLSTAAQTWKRLETEGFIIPKGCQEVGAFQKNKKQEGKKGIKRYKYIPTSDIESSRKFEDYFNPTYEARLIGISKRHLHKNIEDKKSDLEVQEQTNSGFMLDNLLTSKRKSDDYDSLSNKRIKVSITEAINLEE